ncbi:hypothetical protein QL285_053907 [Trifolium repens]|nr:hypothetical protein QL285_053907 [Trifolium repens]
MMGSLDHNVWVWRFDWIDSLSVSEAAAEQELMNLLHPFQPSPDVEDKHKWISSSAGIFSKGVHGLGKPTRSGQIHPIQPKKVGWVGQVGGYGFQK